MTDLSIRDVMCTRVLGHRGPASLSVPFYPSTSFHGSRSSHSLPLAPNMWINQKTWTRCVDSMKETLLVNCGDLLWLLDCFLVEILPTGGEIDMSSASETSASILRKLMSFCLVQKYQKHPHVQTLIAFADAAEEERSERTLALHALAFKILRVCTQKNY
jgi:hypothetical protein